MSEQFRGKIWLKILSNSSKKCAQMHKVWHNHNPMLKATPKISKFEKSLF